jgi:hypothetical protein
MDHLKVRRILPKGAVLSLHQLQHLIRSKERRERHCRQDKSLKKVQVAEVWQIQYMAISEPTVASRGDMKLTIEPELFSYLETMIHSSAVETC